MSVTIIREAIDDIRRWQRDRQVNSEKYSKLTDRGRVLMASSQLKVGDVIEVGKGIRAPADLGKTCDKTMKTVNLCVLKGIKSYSPY